MELDIKLQSFDFSERTPTKTQIENMCNDMSTFLQKVAGSVMATGEFSIKEPFLQHLFNATGGLLAAKDALGANTSGIAQPRGPLPPPPGR